MRFSIIVPVYRVESYICECIESIVKQKFDDYEVLLIDDGSPDNCGKICDDYADKYSKIKVYHKRNGGLSDARNYGMDRAQGEYILFVDGDDWISDNCLSAFDEAIGSDYPDIIETTLIEAYDENNIIKDKGFKDFLAVPLTLERAQKWACCLSENTWPAPKKIYANKFLKENKLRFLEGRLHEDMDWTSQILYHASSYKGCAYPWYYHRMGRKGSITNSISAKNITDVIEMARMHYDLYKKIRDEIHEMVFRRIMVSVYASINLVGMCTEEDKKRVIETISKNKVIFEVAPSFNHKIFATAMKVLGVKIAVKIIGIF